MTKVLAKMDENARLAFREAAEFKPGELTPEEQELVKREGLNALNYIPQKTLQKHSETLQAHEERLRKRNEIMSRPKTDPERIQTERDEYVQKFERGFHDRFDGFGYGMFLFVIFAFAVVIIASHGWPIGIFCGLLMLAVLELCHRLHARN